MSPYRFRISMRLLAPAFWIESGHGMKTHLLTSNIHVLAAFRTADTDCIRLSIGPGLVVLPCNRFVARSCDHDPRGGSGVGRRGLNQFVNKHNVLFYVLFLPVRTCSTAHYKKSQGDELYKLI